MATIALGALGLLWIVFRLYWQGLLLLVAAGGVACVGLARPRTGAPAEPPRKRTRADAPRRTKKRRRRK